MSKRAKARGVWSVFIPGLKARAIQKQMYSKISIS